jgi:regulator of replication initiation timing
MAAGTAVARDSLEQIIEQSKEMEEENVRLRAEARELRAKLAELESAMETLKPFMKLAQDPPRNLQVYINDEAVVQGLLVWGIKYYGSALGDPDHSDDDATRKMARRNISNIVTACCQFGLQRRDDVHRQFLTHV